MYYRILALPSHVALLTRNTNKKKCGRKKTLPKDLKRGGSGDGGRE